MRGVQMLAIAGIWLCGVLHSSASKAELICIHPVPLTIKELVDKQNSDLISKELLRQNTEYLILKYCAATEEVIQPVASVALGDGCEMKSGYRLGGLVHWTTCSATDQSINVPAGEPKKMKPKQLTTSQHLRNCLADYVRRKGTFVPEGQSTAYVKSLSDMTEMCKFAIAHQNYYWEYLKKHPELAR